MTRNVLPETPLGRPANPEARAHRKAQILAGAQRCFIRKGFHAATTAEISSEAGVSVANMYQYFPTKDELIRVMIQADLAEDLDLVRLVNEADTLAEGLEKTIRLTTADHENLSNLGLRLEILAEAARNPRIAAEVRKADAQITAAVAEMIARRQLAGEVSNDIDPGPTADLIMSLFDGMIGRIALAASNPEALARAATQLILAGLGVTPKAAD
ncbi:TetR/AcrR family transcriptional regulator [Phenylobacterium sp.]|uniref:TetR/AcrR family transcriptional regulator n=1 Tax=Phenylobacterium sp. TaxID=1871053 RepID=UPI0025FBB094|nr:TetR/AcrR family transcriptional regulator [Phenylobacterium sp.]MCA6260233.1 TetR/AcrR family transcriptional regulator [Phenylobacterium sp.]